LIVYLLIETPDI